MILVHYREQLTGRVHPEFLYECERVKKYDTMHPIQVQRLDAAGRIVGSIPLTEVR